MIMGKVYNKVGGYSLWGVEEEYVLLSLGSLDFPCPPSRS